MQRRWRAAVVRSAGAGRLLRAALLGLLILAGSAPTWSALAEGRDRMRRPAGPFEAALRRIDPPRPASFDRRNRLDLPTLLAAAPERIAPARPSVASALGGSSPFVTGDAGATTDPGPPDPLARLLDDHRHELADGDAPIVPSGLAAAGEPLRLATLAASGTAGGGTRPSARPADAAMPLPVRLPIEGRRSLAAHLFPAIGTGPHPAVVMLPAESGAHAGPAATRCQEPGAHAEGACAARTLAQRYLAWGRWWASQGVTALLVDTARGTGQDAARAARWLRERDGIDGDRIVLQGWGRSGRVVVATALQGPSPQGDPPSFRSGLALWPDCPGGDGGTGTAPPTTVGFELLVLLAAREGESIVERCAAWLEPSARAGGGIEVVVFDEASRGFDDPAARPATGGRAEWRANRFATQDAMRRAAVFATRRVVVAGIGAAGRETPRPAPPPIAPDRRD